MTTTTDLTVAAWPGIEPRLLRQGDRGLRRVPRHGRLPAARRCRCACSSEVDLSGLLGRGGAAFPLAVKLRTVRDNGRRGGGAVVVANGEEGEPASIKDRWLLRHRPHLVLDGLRLAARMVGATHALRLRLRSARRRGGRDGAGRSRRRRPRRARRSPCVTVEPGYVAGEETAAVRVAQRRAGQADRQAAAPVRRGRRRASHAGQQCRDAGQSAVPAPARRGGVPRSTARRRRRAPSSRRSPAPGGRRRSTRFRTGWRSPNCSTLHGVPADQVRGVLMGGYFAGLLNSDVLDVTLDHESLRRLDSGLGCGAIAILTDDCPVAVAASVMAYFDRENAGQCGSCFNGTAAMSAVTEALRDGARDRRGPGPAGALVGGAARPRRVRDAGRRHQRRGQPAGSVPRSWSPATWTTAARLPCRRLQCAAAL